MSTTPALTADAATEPLAHLSELPMRLTAIVGRARLTLGALAAAGPGQVVELDRNTGEAVDILINDRLVARGEIVTVGDRLGVTITDIISDGED
jgi:flagellar motor switch protein FliN/FliY